MPKPTRRTRPQLQFSLRALLIFVLAFSVFLGLQTHAARRQKEAVALVSELNGMATYDYELEFGPLEYRPLWHRPFENDYFADVIMVDLDGTECDDADLEKLRHLRCLKSLELGDTLITDRGLAQLAELRQLRRLSLKNTGVTDAGVLQLRSLPRMGFLDVRGTRVTSDGVRELQKCFSDCTVFGPEGQRSKGD